jgi:hypothetical protein
MSTPIVHRRKRPIPIDTIQWLGDNEADVQAFTGGAAYFYALDPEDRENSDDPEATATVYDRLHSTWVLVYTGQHIVRGVKGEYYPIAEDVLAETYEDADIPLHASCRTEALTEGARLIEDAASDADWNKPADYCTGLRAGAELLLAKSVEKAGDLVATEADTLANWLHLRFGKTVTAWEYLDLVDREYWEHEAQAVRRAVARGGFRTDVTEAGGDRG